MENQLNEGVGNGTGTAPPAQEFVQMTDPVTQSAVMVPKGLEQFVGHITSTARSSGRKAVQDERDNYLTQFELAKEELDSLRVKLKEKPGSSKEVENLKTEYDKIIHAKEKQIQDILKKSEMYKSKYEDHKTSTDLNQAISEIGVVLHNPQDTIEFLKMKGKARQIEQTDLATGQGKEIFETILTLEIPGENGAMISMDLKSREAVEKFFRMPQHEHLVKNKLSPGGGSVGSNLQGGAMNIDMRLADAQKKGDLVGVVAIKQELYESQKGVK